MGKREVTKLDRILHGSGLKSNNIDKLANVLLNAGYTPASFSNAIGKVSSELPQNSKHVRKRKGPTRPSPARGRSPCMALCRDDPTVK
eukprot:COSAG05_NODE_1957_length_3789_cov_3.333604_5_plen_88_part_00